MADRFFPNVMPDYVAETPPTQEETPPQGGEDSLIKLLSMPFSALSQRLKRTALDLKETVIIYLCPCVYG